MLSKLEIVTEKRAKIADMRRFSQLFAELDETNRTRLKVAALESYFREADSADAAWAVHFLSGNRPRRAVSPNLLQRLICEVSGHPLWLVEECYDEVGDLAETLALLLPEPGRGTDMALHQVVEERIEPMKDWDETERLDCLTECWRELDSRERLVFNKLITGGFRVGVQKTLVARALANVARLEPAAIAYRLSGKWQPGPQQFEALLQEDLTGDDVARPYPFYLAYPIERDPEEWPGSPEDWTVEWKWDGIRAQLIKRMGEVLLWSRGDELITDRFPEIVTAGASLPDGTVLDGEVLAWWGEKPLPFGSLQKRIGRKNVTRKLLDEIPAIFIAYDCLENGGRDVRSETLRYRRKYLESLLEHRSAEFPLRISSTVVGSSWNELKKIRTESRERGVEGFMMKRVSSPYGVGRVKGDWWKWKVDPFTIDAVLIYAQSGHGRRAGLFTDYTFAVWKNDELAPIAKAYSGLTDEEIRQVDQFVRRNTLERFGPVRVVKPELVFELAFDAIQRSNRHKSGIALRFPRMSRWRRDKKPSEVDTIATVEMLLPG